VLPDTRCLPVTGWRPKKTLENRQFQGVVTGVTGVTSNFNDVGADERAAPATQPAAIHTEGEVWAEAWKRDVQRLWPEWMLQAFRELGTEPAPAGGRDCGAVARTPEVADDDAPAMPIMRLPVIPLDDHVEMLAEAMFANRETAMAYLRGVAHKRLSATNDPMARGLLLGWERHWAHSGRGGARGK
jgi:hypothetical protein